MVLELREKEQLPQIERICHLNPAPDRQGNIHYIL